MQLKDWGIKLIHQLIVNGADFTELSLKDGDTPLHCALNLALNNGRSTKKVINKIILELVFSVKKMAEMLCQCIWNTLFCFLFLFLFFLGKSTRKISVSVKLSKFLIFKGYHTPNFN